MSKLHPEANLYDPPGPYQGVGRPRVKGARRAKPSQAAGPGAASEELDVAWYGGGRRRVAVVGEAAHWHKAGQGLVPLRWVSVRDRTGTHRDEYFYADRPGVGRPRRSLVTTAGGGISRRHSKRCGRTLGLETTRGRCVKTVTRAAPCLFGLYSVVTLLYDATPVSERTGRIDWPGKATVTFSDALACVRRRTWVAGVLPQAGCGAGLAELPEPVRELLLTTLAPAA